jgi:shikimate kinase/3-dehydroquinate synthase
MGAGKTSIGRRLAAKLGMEFRDADAEIELAAGCSISEFFARYGEVAFRDGERRVIRRILGGSPVVVAYGGGAFIDAETRAVTRAAAISIWLRCPLTTLMKRVAGRDNRPLLSGQDNKKVLSKLMDDRYPVYAEADIVVDCEDEAPEVTTGRVLQALSSWRDPQRVHIEVPSGKYDVVVGEGLLRRAGSLLAPHVAQKRAIVVTDRNVASLYLLTLTNSLHDIGVEVYPIVIPSGEKSKSLDVYVQLVDSILTMGVERRTPLIALGGGVVGDLTGFLAATILRGLPFIQIPTTLLAQVDSSVGGKTGVNTGFGKNLVGSFYQPELVLADTSVLSTLSLREIRSGYAEILKIGIIGDPGFFSWCEHNGIQVVRGDSVHRSEAISRACRFKADIVCGDEREEVRGGGRAVLNFGHTFAHALETEFGYDGDMLHGEAVALGFGLALSLAVRLGYSEDDDRRRVVGHLSDLGFNASLKQLDRQLSATALISHMRKDKKVRNGNLAFILIRGIGQAFVDENVSPELVYEVLRDDGCSH